MSPSRFSLLKELLIALCVSFISLLALPALIYLVGGRLFGVYEGGLAKFYANTFANLALPMTSAWALVATPGISCLLLRIMNFLARPRGGNTPQQPPTARRQEPTLD